MRIAGLVEAFNFETSIASDLCGNAQTGLSIFNCAKRLCILFFAPDRRAADFWIRSMA